VCHHVRALLHPSFSPYFETDKIFMFMKIFRDRTKLIQKLIERREIVEAEKNIKTLVSDLLENIEKERLDDLSLEQMSDGFFDLFKIQLETKIFSPTIEELLQRCFSLHALIAKKNYRTDRRFLEELEKIKKLIKK